MLEMEGEEEVEMEILDLGRVISWILWVFPKQQSYLLTYKIFH